MTRQFAHGPTSLSAQLALALLVLWGFPAHAQSSPCTSAASAAAAKAQAALNSLAGLLGHAPTSATPCSGSSITAPASTNLVSSPSLRPTSSSTAASTSAPAAASAAPWSPDAPSSSKSAPTAIQFSGSLKPDELPDIAGLHLGISAEQANSLIKQLHPGSMQLTNFGQYMIRASHRSSDPNDNDDLEIAMTQAPGAPVVYFVSRVTTYPRMLSHASALAGLRAKYGHETLAIAGPAPVTGPSDDSRITSLFWLFDEHGKPIAPGPVTNLEPYGCGPLGDNQYMSLVGDYTDKRLPPPGMCESVIVIRVDLSADDMMRALNVTLVDNALMHRAAKATADYQQQQAQQQHQRQLEQSNQVKPAL